MVIVSEKILTFAEATKATVVKLVYTIDLGSIAARREGSSPSGRTCKFFN